MVGFSHLGSIIDFSSMPSQLPKIQHINKTYWSNSFLSTETLRNADLINGTPNSRNAFTAARKFNTADRNVFGFLTETPPQLEASFAREPGTPFGNAHTNTRQAPILPTLVNNAPSDSPVSFGASLPSGSGFFGAASSSPAQSTASTSKPSGGGFFGAASPSPEQSTASSSTLSVPAAVSKGTGPGSSALSPGTHKAGNSPPFRTETDAGDIACYQTITFDPMYSQFSFEVRHSQSRCLA